MWGFDATDIFRRESTPSPPSSCQNTPTLFAPTLEPPQETQKKKTKPPHQTTGNNKNEANETTATNKNEASKTTATKTNKNKAAAPIANKEKQNHDN